MLMPVWRGLGMLLRSTGAAIDALGAAFQGGLAPMERLMPPVNRLKYRGLGPTYPESCFVAPNATVMGNVTIGEGSSIWYGATLRGDVNSITIGRMTNIQDKAVIHVAQHNPSNAALPTVLGSHVTIGHGAILHACTIEDEVLVGMGAKVLDGAIVRRGAIIGGGSVVAPGTEVPSGQVWAGCPARYLRDMEPSEAAFLAVSAHNYADLSREHWNEVTKVHMKVLHEDLLKEDARKRDPNSDEQLGVVRDTYTREITRGPMDGAA